jgi:hypothetical protein
MAARLTIPIAVVMRRRMIEHGRWRVPSWDVLSVLPADHLASRGASREPVRKGDEEEQYLWSGFALELYRDEAESYWYNLTGDNPALYVLCHETPEGDMEPFLVTADHDQGTAGVEADDKVFIAPIPQDIYQEIERFIVEHYVPAERKKRRRKNWMENQPK